MKQLLINCYTWEELTEDQKKKVCEMNRTMDLDILTNEDIVWELSEAGPMIADAGFLNPEVYYSHSYSQGDGACFDCSEFNWELLLEDLEIPHKSLFIKLLNDSDVLEYGIATPNYSYAYHYYHERCRQFFLANAASKHKTMKVDSILYKIMLFVEQKRHDLCLEAFKRIVDTIEHATSDEHLMETLSTFDCYYREDTLQSIEGHLLQEVKEEEP